MSEIKYWDRKENKIVESQIFKETFVIFLNKHPLGRFLMKTILPIKFISTLLAIPKHLKRSKKEILPFIKQYGMDKNEFEKDIDEYTSFADFFIRKLKPEARPVDKTQNALVSPCDSQLTLFENIGPDTSFTIKDSKFKLSTLLRDSELAKTFQNGSLAIFYLAPQDYHRYHYPFTGKLESIKRIGKVLYFVSPIALNSGFRPFDVNIRDISIMSTKDIQKILMIELGAVYVGRMEHTNVSLGEKKVGDEKGYFGLGASTIVLVFPEAKVIWDTDIIEMNNKGIPCKVKQGEKIGLLKTAN